MAIWSMRSKPPLASAAVCRLKSVSYKPAFAGIDQVNQAAIRCTHGGQFQLVGADQAAIRLALVGHRPLQGLGAVLDPHRRGTQRRAMGLEKVMGKGIGFAVEDQVDIALAQQAHILRAMLAGLGETQALQPIAQLGTEAFIHGKLQELDTVVLAGRRGFKQNVHWRSGRFLRQALAGFLFQVQQRAQAIRRIRAGGRGAESHR